MGELVQEIPQDLKITELQVLRLAQVPGTADQPALSLGFPLAGVLHQRHPSSTAASQDRPHSTTGSPSEWMCQRGLRSSLNLLETPSYLSNYTWSKTATLMTAKERSKHRML